MIVSLHVMFILIVSYPYTSVDQIPVPAGAKPEEVEKYKELYLRYTGENMPVQDRYVDFWKRLAKMDLGIATMRGYTGRSVTTIVSETLPYTLVLAIPVLLISFFVGNWIGAKSAYSRSKLSDAGYYLSLFCNQLPYFWFAMILVFLLGHKAGIFPIEGVLKPINVGKPFSLDLIPDYLHHYALPFLSLLIVWIGGWAIGMRSMTLYELDSSYILYSRQLGFRGERLRSYAQRNAILPQFTGLNLNLNSIISQTMIVELVFRWKGIGLLSYYAAFNGDGLLMLGVFLVSLIVVLWGNFLIDIAYAFLDPRIRTGYGE